MTGKKRDDRKEDELGSYFSDLGVSCHHTWVSEKISLYFGLQSSAHFVSAVFHSRFDLFPETYSWIPPCLLNISKLQRT